MRNVFGPRVVGIKDRDGRAEEGEEGIYVLLKRNLERYYNRRPRRKVEAAYKRGDLLEKRRPLMAEWANYCATLPEERGKVVRLKRKAKEA